MPKPDNNPRCFFWLTTLLLGLAWQHANAVKLSADSLIKLGEVAVGNEHYAEAIGRFLNAQQLAKEQHHADNLYLSTYDMGVCYFYIGEYAEALNQYYDALDICNKNNMTMARRNQVMAAVAGVYFEENNMDKANEILTQCYDMATEANDTLNLLTFCTDLALICNKRGLYDKALQYLDEGDRLLDIIGDKNYANTNVVRSETFFLMHRYDDFERLAPSILDNPMTKRNDRCVVLTYLVKICRERGDMGTALHYADEAMSVASTKNKPTIFEQLSLVYKNQGNLERAFQMKDSVILYKDSLTIMHNRQLSENEKVRLDVIQLRGDMERNQLVLGQHRSIIALLACICLLIAVAAYQHVKRMRAKSQMQVAREQQERLLVERQMRETELIARHQQELAKHQQQITEMSLEQKMHELSATTMFVSSRNALIEDLLASLSDVACTDGNSKINELVGHLNKLLKENKKNNDFLVNFESANPDFTQELKKRHDDLTSADIRFLAYVRMNLSVKEIATLIGVNPDSCKRRKIRLSKKLGLDTSSDLYDYLVQL